MRNCGCGGPGGRARADGSAARIGAVADGRRRGVPRLCVPVTWATCANPCTSTAPPSTCTHARPGGTGLPLHLYWVPYTAAIVLPRRLARWSPSALATPTCWVLGAASQTHQPVEHRSMLLPLVSLSLLRLSLLLLVSRCDAAPVARPVTRITLALAANNTAKVCPAGTMRISALSPWDGDLNAGAHVPTPWTPQCGEALHARCGLAKVPGAHVSCVGCLQNNSAALLEANCTQDSAVAWCAQPAAGSFVHLCFGVVATERPVSNLCAFTTPSNADPDGDCPHGWEKIDGESPEHNFNTGSTNVGAGYICMQRALSQQDGELSSQD